MIAADTSSLIAYLQGDSGSDVDAVDHALTGKHLVLPPVVLSELLSDPNLPDETATLFRSLPCLEVADGYWERAGAMRASAQGSGARARLADTLIAQSCIDHRTPLITRDADFAVFVRKDGLILFR